MLLHCKRRVDAIILSFSSSSAATTKKYWMNLIGKRAPFLGNIIFPLHCIQLLLLVHSIKQCTPVVSAQSVHRPMQIKEEGIGRINERMGCDTEYNGGIRTDWNGTTTRHREWRCVGGWIEVVMLVGGWIGKEWSEGNDKKAPWMDPREWDGEIEESERARPIIMEYSTVLS